MPDLLFEQAADLQRRGEFEEAERRYRRLAARGRDDWPLHHNLGALAAAQSRYPAAERAFRTALQRNSHSAASLSGLGNALLYLQRPDEAEVVLRKAWSIQPGNSTTAYRLSWALLQQGRYAEAWPWFEYRPGQETIPLDGVGYPKWEGQPVRGKSLLIWGEQGLGDEIQMIRFVRALREAGASRITVVVEPPNVPLFRDVGADLVLPRRGKLSIPRHDYWCPMMSLPYRLGIDRHTLRGGPYLPGPRASATAPVGVVLSGNPAHPNDRHRSIRDRSLLTAIPDAILLEPGADALENARSLSRLRALVTVDTMWAHLAGAMGLPCHILVAPDAADWRWEACASTTPWYESVRLYWQDVRGDWTAPLAAAARAVKPASGP